MRNTAAWLVVWLAGAFPAAADLEEIKARGRLRAVTVTSGGGIDAVLGRARGGFDFEILESFARLQRVELEVVSISGWSDLIPFLLAGNADVIAGGFNVSEGRREQIDFTVETLPTRSVAVSYKPRSPVTRLEELIAGPVGTLKGSAQSEQLLAAGVPQSRIVLFVKTLEMREALKKGQILAQITPVETALVSRTIDAGFQLGLYVGPPGSMAFGVRKQDKRLRDALSEYVLNVRRTATWNRLLVKYYGEAAIDILKRARTE